MTPQDVILECSEVGVSIHLNGDSIRLRGPSNAVKTVSDVVRAHKTIVIEHLSNVKTMLVNEFMATDGLSFEDATALASVSVQPRPPEEWLRMITELDSLIDRYCSLYALSGEAREHILSTRRSQSLGSIPATLAWFKTELSTERTASAHFNERY